MVNRLSTPVIQAKTPGIIPTMPVNPSTPPVQMEPHNRISSTRLVLLKPHARKYPRKRRTKCVQRPEKGVHPEALKLAMGCWAHIDVWVRSPPVSRTFGRVYRPARGRVVRPALLMETKALSVAKQLISRAWSGQSMLEGVSSMMVKEELPDDPADLMAMIKEPQSL